MAIANQIAALQHRRTVFPLACSGATWQHHMSVSAAEPGRIQQSKFRATTIRAAARQGSRQQELVRCTMSGTKARSDGPRSRCKRIVRCTKIGQQPEIAWGFQRPPRGERRVPPEQTPRQRGVAGSEDREPPLRVLAIMIDRAGNGRGCRETSRCLSRPGCGTWGHRDLFI